MSLKGDLTLQRGCFYLKTGEFELPLKGVTAIFGRSGSGKTTLLRCLAGLENDVMGQLSFNDQVWLKDKKQFPVHKRKLGYVFQEANLFQHLTVEENLWYGFKRYKRLIKGGITIHFEQVVAWLSLEPLLQRNPNTLSGGERQRVAIGRALLSQPKILLMDEPMASLDLYAKREIMPYLERLRDELAIPILYVTHSPDEVERLADSVLFMEQGRITHFEAIEQALNRVGTPLYQSENPRAVLSAEVVSHDKEDGLTCLKVGQELLWVPEVSNQKGERVRVVVSAQHVSLLAEKSEKCSVLNHLSVTIKSIEAVSNYGVLVHLRVANKDWPLLAKITKRSQRVLNLKEGQQWIAAIKSVSILN
ncbi:Molybdenum ABC transporter ATP-binding protein ModC [hydrothermal vent metagenome]|uniref:Molybdenum ABC transporter ATP-binding protein ModC n=1 Tax=hydrothermal vent metagenome TaxID=652676 RepID=A0A3B0VQ25_9ZZZZ